VLHLMLATPKARRSKSMMRDRFALRAPLALAGLLALGASLKPAAAQEPHAVPAGSPAPTQPVVLELTGMR
jgi:hypothetical protein